MSRNQRLVLLGLAALVLAIAVVVASTSGGDSKTAAVTTGATTATTTPSVTRVALKVARGQGVGGVRDISVTQGRRVAITVASPDYSGEIHLHGYDIMRNVAPGKPARFDLAATQEGVFDMEVEATSAQIAKLTVNP